MREKSEMVEVVGNDRLHFYTEHMIGVPSPLIPKFERLCFEIARGFLPDYECGDKLWHMIMSPLSNKHWFVCPSGDQLHFSAPLSFSSGKISAKAAGIAITIMAVNQLLFIAAETEDQYVMADLKVMYNNVFNNIEFFDLSEDDVCSIFQMID